MNGTAPPPCHLRDATNNPYSKNFCKQAPCSSSTAHPKTASVLATTTMLAKPTSSAATVASVQINEDSPTIKQILAATGYASVEELLASHANTDGTTARNGSIAATNVPKSAMNGAKASKSTN